VGLPIVSTVATGAPSFVSTAKFDVGFPVTVQTTAPDADQALCGLVTTPFIYAWSLRAPLGSRAALVGPTSAMPGFVPDVVGNYVLTLVLTDSTGPASTQTFTLPVTCAASGALAVDDAVAHLAALSATQVVPLVNLKTGGPTPNFTLVHSTLPDSDATANKNLNVPFYLGMPVQLAANVPDASTQITAACPGGYPVTIAYQWALVGVPPGSSSIRLRSRRASSRTWRASTTSYSRSPTRPGT
jgi:hypothetical protein